MNYLKLTLSSVLQYFSDTDSIALRTTYNTSLYPTKQAIVGMIASALGYERKDPRSAELYKKLDLKYSIVNEPVILNDFQTIKPLRCQQNYMNKFNKRNKFQTVDGAYQNKQLIKKIQYLQEAEYEVYVGGSDELLEEIYNAIRNPEYSLFIGKRSCIPNKPIVTEFNLIKKEELKNVHDCA
jgi:CRISPR system Cascade subunit CasD